MTYHQAQNLLERHGQARLLSFWDTLGAAQRESLLAQIASLDFDAIRRMRELLQTRAAPHAAQAAMTPAGVLEPSPAQRKKAAATGESALRAGRVGVILVAGGQGTRLHYPGPKGAYPIGPVTDAPLFYYHARRVLGMSRRHQQSVPLYIMTSAANDAETRAFFTSRDFFGLPPNDVFFFQQGMFPALGPDGKIILETPSRIFMSPDGHGGTLSALENSGALADMKKRGLETLFYFQVDNPLVEIADPAFIGAHLQAGADYSLKLCAKREPNEGLGVVVRRGGLLEMVEYTELTREQKEQRAPNGELIFKYGSVAIHAFSLAFLRQQAGMDMPLHLAHKKIPFVDDNGATREPAEPNGYKFEKFIFDLLPRAKNAVCLAFDRAEEFAPVKNAVGADSPETCRRALSAKNARILAAAGVNLPFDADDGLKLHIELDPCLALLPDELKKRLKTTRK